MSQEGGWWGLNVMFEDEEEMRRWMRCLHKEGQNDDGKPRRMKNTNR